MDSITPNPPREPVSGEPSDSPRLSVPSPVNPFGLGSRRMFITVSLVVFLVEVGLMLGLSNLPPLPLWQRALVDAGLLVALIFPVLFYLVLRPMQRWLTYRRQIEAKIRQMNATLNEQVQKRTLELELTNKGLVRAMADQQLTADSLQHSLREKDALLKEVHHRVKNNLQVIASLLRMEATKRPEPQAKAALTDMQGRIRSMALLHETLYRSSNLAAVNLAVYLRQVATGQFRFVHPEHVELKMDMSPVSVNIDQAIPCGLIINELVTNALKHGFPEGQAGVVRVDLRQGTSGSVELTVSDNGIGLPENFDPRVIDSLGLRLAADLSRQLQGSLQRGSGASFTLRFNPRAATSHPFATVKG